MELRPDDTVDHNDPFGSRSARGLRMRVGLGAGVILVILAAGIAVVVSAASSHPASASGATTGYSTTSSSGTSKSAHAAPEATDATTDAAGATPSTAFVQVVGQVQKPGLYELPAGDRMIDAISAAGGFTPTADQASLNLAQVIADGQQIAVAAKGATATLPGAAPGPSGGSGSFGSVRVDINTADATGLESLDGIGPALAQRILSYRTAHSGFRSVNDLQNVTGIGPKKFAAIKGSVST